MKKNGVDIDDKKQKKNQQKAKIIVNESFSKHSLPPTHSQPP